MIRTDERGTLRWGISRGVLFGAVFSVVLGLAMLIRGSAVYGGATFPKILAVTTILGFLGGLCVGFLKPFTRSSWGAVTVGSVGGVFAGAAIWKAEDRRPAAIDAAKEAVARSPQDWTTWAALGQAEEAVHDRVAARNALRRVRVLNPRTRLGGTR